MEKKIVRYNRVVVVAHNGPIHDPSRWIVGGGIADWTPLVCQPTAADSAEISPETLARLREGKIDWD